MPMDSDVKLKIYNVAVTVFNMRPFTLEEIEDADGSNPNLQTFDTLLNPALDMAMREYDWSFLQSVLDMGSDLGAVGAYPHSYKLPDGLFRLCKVRIGRRGHHFQRIGNTILTFSDDAPTAFGIMENFDTDKAPRDFWALVGYALAFMASNSISPGDSKATTAMSLYQKIAQNMIINDAQNDGNDYMCNEGVLWPV